MRFFAAIFALLPSLSFAGASVDLTAVPISQVVGLYFKEASKRPYVVCSDVLEDSRLVSVRADAATLKSAFSSLLASYGYAVTEYQGVSVVCKSAAVQSSSAGDEIVIYRPRYRPASWLVGVASTVVQGKFANKSSHQQGATRVGGQDSVGGGEPLGGQVNTDNDDLILFTGVVSHAKRLRELLPQIDTPVGDVVVKATIYEITKSGAYGSALQALGGLLSTRLGVKVGGPVLSNSLTFDSGNLHAVFSALDSDSNFKMLTSPYARVRSGGRAQFSVGQDVPVLGSIVTNGNGQSQQSIEYRQSGVIFEVSPVAYDGGVSLGVSQEVSSFVRTETGLDNSPTLNKRALRTTLWAKPGQVIVLGGLNDNTDENAKSGLNWLPFSFSKTAASRSTELLLFLEVMTDV